MFLVVGRVHNKGKDLQGLWVVSMLSTDDPLPVRMVLPRDADNWQRDIEIDDLQSWEKATLQHRLPLIDEFMMEDEDDA